MSKLISSIYERGKDEILHKSGSRKGHSKKTIMIREILQRIGKRKSPIHIVNIKKILTDNKKVKKLNNWEVDFMNNISKQSSLSHKQNNILKKIEKK